VRKHTVVGLWGLLLTIGLLMAAPMTASATSLSFGGIVNSHSQPSNAEDGYTCDENANIPDHATCTWVSTQAYHNGGHERAPATGRIGLVRLVSCVPGSFRLQFAQAVPSTRQARIVYSGPVITYLGQGGQGGCGGADGDVYLVQTFHVSVPVVKGDYIAIQAKGTGALYCSGGSGTLLFSPVLATAGAYRHAQSGASCNLIIQLFYSSVS
jgi:hypothetical protein